MKRVLPIFSPSPAQAQTLLRWALGLFVLPLVLAWWAFSSATLWPWVLASVLQAPSLIAERWVFFAQAKHPQNLYYQTVG